MTLKTFLLQMPVLTAFFGQIATCQYLLLSANVRKEKPLQGVRIGACLHVTTETANLMHTLKAGGAEVTLCASNPLQQDDTAAALVKHFEIPVYAIKGENTQTYYEHVDAIIDTLPQITMDDGADVVGRIHETRTDALETIIGGTEETTTGVIRLAAWRNKVL